MMFEVDKIYTKEEFLKLKDSELGILIGSYDCDSNGNLYEYYSMISNNDEVGIFNLIKIDKIDKIMNEAFDKLWFNRHGYQDIEESDIKKNNIDKSDRIVKDYNIDKDSVMNDFDCGYWSGILAVLRYLVYGHYSYEDLRNKDNNILSL